MFCKWSSPVSFFCAEEELGSVGVGPGISHGQDARACVLQLEVLICKLLPVDGFASSSIVPSEVPALKKVKVNSAFVATAITKI